MKRLSTFRKKKDESRQGPSIASNGANGTGNAAAANGVQEANGTKPKPAAKRFSFAQPKGHSSSSDSDDTPKAADGENPIEQFAQLLHASGRPLPTQTGDGSYVEHEVSSSLFQDMKALGFKDINTLREVLQSHGELQDDKSMLMERVIQVSYLV